MKILQQPIKVKRHSRVNVHFSRPCTVYLMTEVNFKRYKDGASFRRLGGQFDQSPAEFIAPYDGTWHAVIEKGSHFSPQPIEGRVEVLSPLMKDIPYFTDDEDVEAIAADNSIEELAAESEEEVEDTSEESADDKGEEEEEEEKE